ncbi:MAG: hypothetical protein K2O84_06150 [Oscillospiraceae bacterium]|nr:hypothetical protein [Oscillospiraceae bacterium]
MTGKEMTELFAVMLLAWPNAETFKGGIAKLAPTINLWVSCTADVDFWTGQQAVIRLCQHCKFPPTIAEFREQVDNVNKDIKSITSQTFQEIRNAELMYGSIEEFYTGLPPGNFTRAVIDTVGGVAALTRISKDVGGHEHSMWNWSGIEDACQTVIRGRPAMVGGELPALNAKNGR